MALRQKKLKQKRGDHMTLKAIGAGYGRTGTDSARIALEILGLGPCHHMREVLSNQDRYRMWQEVANGADRDWNRLVGGYGSAVDWPTVTYWKELAKLFPDAKILLTWRSPESWVASYQKTLRPAVDDGPDPSSFGKVVIRDQTFEGRHDDAGFMAAKYREHVEDVLTTAPAGRLIVHRIGDGWGPLCAGFGIPEPDVPFPSGNSTNDFLDDAELNAAHPEYRYKMND